MVWPYPIPYNLHIKGLEQFYKYEYGIKYSRYEIFGSVVQLQTILKGIIWSWPSYLMHDIQTTLFQLQAINPFIPTDHFSLIQNNEWKSSLKLLSVERVKNPDIELQFYLQGLDSKGSNLALPDH